VPKSPLLKSQPSLNDFDTGALRSGGNFWLSPVTGLSSQICWPRPGPCIEEKIIGDTTGYRPYVSGLIVVLMCSECVTAPPRNHRSLRLRIPAGRASHAWLSHAPRATTEANTLWCIAEVPVLVYYHIFPTHHPGNTATSNRVWFAIESECCGFTDRFRLCIACHISIYRRLTGARAPRAFNGSQS
jgi:hypothetical protein